MKKAGKKIFLYLGLLGLLFCSVMVWAADAQNIPDLMESPLSLKIIMKYPKEEEHADPIPGVTVQIIQTADLSVDQGKAEYKLKKDFAEIKIPFSDMTASDSIEVARALDKLVESKGLSGPERVTDTDGVAIFTELSPGIYLIRQTGKESEMYEKVTPFLVTVPFWKSVGTVGQWIYQVETFPKTEIHKIPTPTHIPTPTPLLTPTPEITPPQKTPPENTPPVYVKTSDDTPIEYWILVLFLSVCIIGVVICRKRNKKE